MIGTFKCLLCKNYISGRPRDFSIKCKAFPDGIPEMKLAFISHDPCNDCNKGIGFEPENTENKDQPPSRYAKTKDEDLLLVSNKK